MTEAKFGDMKVVDFKDVIFGERAREEYGDIDDLALSIENMGLLEPLVVDKKLNILDGGRRYKAVEKLNWTKIPVIIVNVTEEKDSLEVELVANLLRKDFHWTEKVKLLERIDTLYREKNEGNWSQEKTAKLLETSVGTVNEQLQLAQAIKTVPELAKAKTDSEAMQKLNTLYEKMALNELKKKRGDKGKSEKLEGLIKEAEKSYMIGDVIEGLKSLKTDSEDLIFAEVDPPYAIELKSKKRLAVDKDITADYVEIKKEDYKEFLKELHTELYRVLAPESTFIFWFGIQWYAEVLSSLQNAGFLVDYYPGIWTKTHGQVNQRHTHLARLSEFFFYGRKTQERGSIGVVKKGRGNIFDFPGVPSQNKIHPTQRPKDLITEIFETFIVPAKGTILVPFMGSGMTYLAAKDAGFDAFGWDLVENYREKFLFVIQETYNKRFKL